MLQFFIILSLINCFIGWYKISEIFKKLNLKLNSLLFIMFFFFVSYYNNKFIFNNFFNYTYAQLYSYSLINIFNTNWTNLYFLILIFFFYFFFYFCTHNFVISNRFISQYFCLFISITCIYISKKNFAESCSFFNEKFFIFSNFLPNVNLLLFNNLVIIHPITTQMLYGYLFFSILFYVFIETIFYNIYSAKISLKKKNKTIQVYSLNFFLKKNLNYGFFFKIAYIATILGSIWAAQELVWNSWWNWDTVEIIAFNFLIILIFFMHFLKKKYALWIFFNFSLNILVSFLLFYFFIRLDISGSLHSFNSFPIIEIYFYFFCWLYALINFILFLKKYTWWYSFYNLKNKANLLNLVRFNKLALFFKLFLFGNYIYCFFIWLNDLSDFTMKNEIILFYSLFYKYLTIFYFFVFFFVLRKINWTTTILIDMLNMWGMSIHIYLRNYLAGVFKNKFILLHASIIVFIAYLFFDYTIQIFSWLENINKKYFESLIKISRKINLFYWDIKILNFFFVIQKYINFKLNHNQFLFLKQSIIFSNNLTFNIWGEQFYNYYVSVKINNYFLKNLFFLENNVNISSANILHYSLLIWFFFFLIFFKIKLKIFNFF